MDMTVGNWITIGVYLITFAGTWGGITTRIKALESKVEKHNNMVERMYLCEASAKSAHHRLDEFREELKRA